MRQIAVFFGCRSSEREISVITGMFCTNLLRGEEYRVLPVYIDGENQMFLTEKAVGVEEFRHFDCKRWKKIVLRDGGIYCASKGKKLLAKVDCALNCCHGGMGEDGTLSSLLALAKIPLASPNACASALFMNKHFSQLVARGLEIPTVRSFAFFEEEYVREKEKTLDRICDFAFPLVVKPCNLGSSIGISVVQKREELEGALSLAFTLDRHVLIEEYLPDRRDINCAAYSLDGEIYLSECEEVFSNGQILSFSEKYEGTGARLSQQPADVPKEAEMLIKQYTATLYRTFSLRGVVRADFFYTPRGVYFNEMNSVPGSLACYLFGEELTSARKLLKAVIEDCLSHPERKKTPVHTGILDRTIFCGSKGCKTR